MTESAARPVPIIILASLAVLASLGAQLHFAAESSARRIGTVIEAARGGLEVLALVPSGPAERAGLAVGDLIIAVGGQHPTTEAAYDQVARGYERGKAVRFEVRRGAETETLTVLPGMPRDWKSTALGIFGVLAHLALWVLGFAHPSRDLRARLLAFLALAIAAELALPSVIVGSPIASLVAGLAFYLATGFQFGLELHLLSMIPERRPFLVERPWLVQVYYAAGLGFATLAAFAFATETLRGPGLFPLASGTLDDLLRYGFLPTWALAAVILLGTAAWTWPQALGRQQAALVLLGLLPWAIVAVTNASLGLAGNHPPPWFDLAEEIAIILFPVAVFVAIFRSELFDLALVVRRTLLYTAATSFVVLAFYGLVGMGGAVLSDLLGGASSVWVVGGATLLLGLLFTPLKETLESWIDRRFFPHRAEIRQRLIDLADRLASHGKIAAMAEHLAAEVCGIFAVESATLYLAPGAGSPLIPLAHHGAKHAAVEFLSPADHGLAAFASLRGPLALADTSRGWGAAQRLVVKLGGEIMLPLQHQGELTGTLVLGGKSDGRPFAADEQEMLQLLCHHVSAVFENARLFTAATEDGLTGLLRREVVCERLALEIARAKRYRRPLAVAMLDLDHFKAINDEHGHAAGDALLRAVARALKTELRTTDFLGRFGGEEFLLVLPETDLEGAAQVAEKLRRRIAALAVEAEDGRELAVSLSIGLAALDGRPRDAAASPETLLEAADQALYRAKHSGRNRIEPAAVEVAEGATTA